MTSPWERLREAGDRLRAGSSTTWLGQENGPDWMRVETQPELWHEFLAVLAALPATPPEQPASDAERERAILDAFRWMGHADECREHRDGPETCDCGSDAARRKAVALMRSAPQPGTITCKCGAVATLLPIDCKSSVGWIGCAKCGHELMRWGPEPVPAPPASDWRERWDWRDRLQNAISVFDIGEPESGRMLYVVAGLRAACDGLAALEAEVARMRKEKP